MAFDAHYPARPTAGEVATLLRSRTVDEYGNEEQGFDAQTRPTLTQAEELIDAAYDLVRLRVGRIPDDADEIISQAKSVVMLLAARIIETVYYPEQARSDESAATLYGEMYEDAIRDLEGALKDDRSTTRTGFMASIPMKGLAALDESVWPINYEQRDMDDPLT
jgi:hypothetical protein